MQRVSRYKTILSHVADRAEGKQLESEVILNDISFSADVIEGPDRFFFYIQRRSPAVGVHNPAFIVLYGPEDARFFETVHYICTVSTNRHR